MNYVCVYVCVCDCMYVCTYVYLYVCVCIMHALLQSLTSTRCICNAISTANVIDFSNPSNNVLIF